MRRFWLSLLSLAIMLVLLGGLIALDQTVFVSATDYIIRQINGQTYMVFDVPYTGSRETMVGCIVYPSGFLLDSVQELARSIQDHSFTDDQFHTIRAFFPYDEIGVKILNPALLRDVKAPVEFTTLRVEWRGNSYSHLGATEETSEGANRFWLFFLSPDEIRTAFSAFTTPVHTAIHRREADRDADVFYDFSFTQKEIRYRIGTDSCVIEKYQQLPTGHGNLQSEEFTLLEVILYKILNDGSGFCVEIYGLSERPSMEWLSQFGVSEPIGE